MNRKLVNKLFIKHNLYYSPTQEIDSDATSRHGLERDGEDGLERDGEKVLSMHPKDGIQDFFNHLKRWVERAEKVSNSCYMHFCNNVIEEAKRNNNCLHFRNNFVDQETIKSWLTTGSAWIFIICTTK